MDKPANVSPLAWGLVLLYERYSDPIDAAYHASRAIDVALGKTRAEAYADAAEIFAKGKAEAYEEIAQRILSQRYVPEDMRKQLAQAIRQHSQKGEE